MEELLMKYSPAEIIIFAILLIMAIKGVWSIVDWFKARFNDGYSTRKKKEVAEENMKRQDEKINSLTAAVTEMQKDIRLLLDSDRDDIKAWITQQHHYFMAKGSIDSFSLQCIEKRYEHYVTEGGNSFVGDLMKDIRSLPIVN